VAAYSALLLASLPAFGAERSAAYAEIDDHLLESYYAQRRWLRPGLLEPFDLQAAIPTGRLVLARRA
jgi:hypothetical protein